MFWCSNKRSNKKPCKLNSSRYSAWFSRLKQRKNNRHHTFDLNYFASDRVFSWKSKRLSKESVKTLDTSDNSPAPN